MLLEEQKFQSKHQAVRNVVFVGLAVLMVFLILFCISAPFEYDAGQSRPVLAVVALLIVSSALAFAGLGFALQVPQSQCKNLLAIVFVLAVSLRLVAIFTPPILEIDYYRYIWDGKAVCEGISPYRFSPAQILEPGVSTDESLNRLKALSTRCQSNYAVLNRIHYGSYSTVYPPVSQFVFAATMKLTPESATVKAHVIAIKIAMTLFDLGTILLLAWLLKIVRVHLGWLIAYAWNPLVIKEIANSGHLDSIATFLFVLAFCFVARQKILPSSRHSKTLLAFAGVTLGLGVGAKLFPVVVFPALLVAVIGKNGHREINSLGSRLFAGGVFSVAFVLTSCSVLFPVLLEYPSSSTGRSRIEAVMSSAANKTGPTKRQDGFGGFFSSWRMNDPVFSTVYFNLKSDTRESSLPWFVFTTKRWRNLLDQQVRTIGLTVRARAYLITRILTLSVFALYYLWQLVKLYSAEHDDRQWTVDLACRITMILSVFLFLQPTVNTWYFVWVAPLACLTNNRGWLLASGFLTLYYLRFWFKSLAEPFAFGGQSYDGVKLFDHGFVFVEFGLIIAVLICLSKSKKHRETYDTASTI